MHRNPQIGREGMRRLCALFLLVLSVGPWLVAFSSPDAITEASLPACCRTHGKHKCFTRFTREESRASNSGGAAVSQVSKRCPYNPTWITTAHSDPFGHLAKDVFRIGFGGTASLVAIATRPCTSFRSRANCKRGPPSPALSFKTTTDRLAAEQRLPLHWRHDASTKTDIFTLCSDASSIPDYTA
jgi:hypothetical protein